MNKLIQEYRDSGDIAYLERMINGAFSENRRGMLDKYIALVILPEFGVDIAEELRTYVTSNPMIHSINL